MASWIMVALLATGIGNSPDVVIVEFSAAWCQPCQQMQPAIARLSQEGWSIRKIDTDRERDLAERFRVQSLPTMVILVRGQEIDRIVGAASYEQIVHRFAAAGRAARSAPTDSQTQIAANSSRSPQTIDARPSNPRQPTVRGQSPSSMGAFPMLAAAGTVSAMAANVPSEFTSSGQVPGKFADQPLVQQSQNITPDDVNARVQAATVRIRIDDASSQAFGTGTIVDTHGDEALVLTCGHILRDLKADSKLFVELFLMPQVVSLPAQVIDFDATDADIGLISFRTPMKLTPAVISTANNLPRVGQNVFSYGCDRGADPSRRDTQIKRINRYLGASNLEIVGAPVVGRSGGGLFDAQGRLIGVCNAADTEDDEGIYAGPPVVHQQLRKLGLARLIDGSSQTAPAVKLASLEPSTVRPAAQPTNSTASDTPVLAWPDQHAQPPGRQLGSLVNSQIPSNLSASALATQANTQLICIIRDVQGQDRVVTVNSPSPELLDSIQRLSASR